MEGNIILGVIYLPRFDELFYAVKGKGAYKNGKKIHCSGVKKVAAALLASYSEEVNSPYFPYYAAVGHKAQGVRIFGAATVDLVNVAQGYTDGYMEFDLKPWDMAAGGLIVEEAGGRVTDLNGNLLDLFGHQILATNGKIHKEMVEIFKKID